MMNPTTSSSSSTTRGQAVVGVDVGLGDGVRDGRDELLLARLEREGVRRDDVAGVELLEAQVPMRSG